MIKSSGVEASPYAQEMSTGLSPQKEVAIREEDQQRATSNWKMIYWNWSSKTLRTGRLQYTSHPAEHILQNTGVQVRYGLALTGLRDHGGLSMTA